MHPYELRDAAKEAFETLLELNSEGIISLDIMECEQFRDALAACDSIAELEAKAARVDTLEAAAAELRGMDEKLTGLAGYVKELEAKAALANEAIELLRYALTPAYRGTSRGALDQIKHHRMISRMASLTERD